MLSQLALTLATLSAPAPAGMPTLNVTLPAELERTALRDLALAATQSDAWATIDPTLAAASQLGATAFRFRDVSIVRVSPELASKHGVLPIEGADRLVLVRDGQIVDVRIGAAIDPVADFVVSREDALRTAWHHTPGCVVSEAEVASMTGVSAPVWVANEGGLQPAWRIRLPTLRPHDLTEVWVHGATGDVMRTQPGAVFQGPDPDDAAVFFIAPDPAGLDVGDLEPVKVRELVDTSAGAHMFGQHFLTSNCCKYYSCATLPEAECNISDVQDPGYPASVMDRVCADGPVAGTSFQSRVLIAVPASLLPFNPGFDPVWVSSVFCTEAPALTTDGNGWFPTPVDGAAVEAESDHYAELHTYHWTQTFFEHIRTVLGDPGFCLDDPSMQCDPSGASIDADGDGLPDLPFHITTNLVIPDVLSDDFLTNITLQLLGGKGRASTNPLTIDAYGRLGNAAFIPATTTDQIGIPPEFGPLADLFARPYDSNVYMQGERDFGYDGDVIFHEFTHAIVHTLSPGLWSLGRDEWGSTAFPGAMNEGWADYFAASYSGDSLTGEYAGGGEGSGIRDAQNANACPADLTGEVHDDSLPWSGALWDIREAVVAADPSLVNDLDALFLANVATADAPNGNATFERLAADIAAQIYVHPTLAPFTTDAEVGSSRVDLQACKLEYSIVSPK